VLVEAAPDWDPKTEWVFEIIPSTELMKMEFPPIQWLVEDFIPEGLTLLAAPPKVGKTFFANDLTCCLATGRDFMGLKTTRMRTLYLDAEQSKRLIQGRMRELGWNQ